MDNRARRTLYLVAGMYVFYLGIKLIGSFIKGAEGNPVVSLIGGILFLGCGGFLIVDYIIKTKKAFQESQNENEEVVEGEATVIEETNTGDEPEKEEE